MGSIPGVRRSRMPWSNKPMHPQLQKPMCLEPELCNRRRHAGEKPPLTATRENPCAATKTQHNQKLKTNKKSLS